MLTHAAIEARASTLAGTPVTIVCQADVAFAQQGLITDDDGSVLGYVLIDQITGKFIPRIHLRSQLCHRLAELGATAHRNEWDTTNPKDQGYGPKADHPDGQALGVLEHEAVHIRTGSENESFVECQAYKNRWAAIKEFRPLARWKQWQIYWGMKILHQDTLPNYREVC